MSDDLERLDWHDYAEACLLHDRPHGAACCVELHATARRVLLRRLLVALRR